jgi:hypothetical protein
MIRCWLGVAILNKKSFLISKLHPRRWWGGLSPLQMLWVFHEYLFGQSRSFLVDIEHRLPCFLAIRRLARLFGDEVW